MGTPRHTEACIHDDGDEIVRWALWFLFIIHVCFGSLGLMRGILSLLCICTLALHFPNDTLAVSRYFSGSLCIDSIVLRSLRSQAQVSLDIDKSLLMQRFANDEA